MDLELKKQLLKGIFTIVAALIGAAGVVLAAIYGQEISSLKAENLRLEETISALTEERSQLNERNAVLENESKASTDTNTNSADTGSNFNEDPITQNLDAILQSKSEYVDSDTQLIESDKVWVTVSEKAGYMYYDPQNSDNYLTLRGKSLDAITVYFLDYETNNVICTLLSGKDGFVEYYPGNTRRFFCVVIPSEYELFVSNPIQVLGGEQLQAVDIVLDRADSRYSHLFQVRIKTYDSSQATQEICTAPISAVSFQCVDRYSDHSSFSGIRYLGRTSGSGILESGSKCFFSLNTRYVLDISLNGIDILSGEEMSLPYETVDDSIKDTNLIDIFFEYDGSKISLQQDPC